MRCSENHPQCCNTSRGTIESSLRIVNFVLEMDIAVSLKLSAVQYFVRTIQITVGHCVNHFSRKITEKCLMALGHKSLFCYLEVES